MKNQVSLYELDSVSKCRLRKSRNISTKMALSVDMIERSRLAKEVVKEVIGGVIDGASASQKIDDFFKNSNLPTDETKRAQAVDMKHCINRYLACECRKAIFPAAQEMDIFGINVLVNPDMVFVSGASIEVVRLRYSRPKLKTKVNKNSNSLSGRDSLEMYALLQFGRSFIAKGHNATVTASTYYLRKSNDSMKNGVFDSDFFDTKGKNVISVSELYHANDATMSDLDIEMEQAYKDFAKGVEMECDETRCKSCDFFSICSFKKAPKAILKENKVRSIGTINLTPNQATAIDFDNGVTRINAGAGAGKTLTIALRTVELLKKGNKPEEIALLTFTNGGAIEMKERIQVYNDEFGTGCDISNMIATTFNAFGDSIIRANYQLLGFTKEPTLIDDVERASIITKLLKDKQIPSLDFRNYSMNTKDVKGALTITKQIFDIMKTNNLDEFEVDEITTRLGYMKRFVDNAGVQAIAELYCDYVFTLRQECLIEYSDQELMVFELFNKKPALFEEMGIKHIIVDEYQDSNIRQLSFIKMMLNTSHFTSLMVVGDDSQAIFGFRDTSPEYIINFFQYIGITGQDFFLMENYRSTPEIIQFANKLNDINENKVIKSLISTRDSGKPVVARCFKNAKEETKYIVESIKEKVANGERYENIAYIASTKNELMKMASLLTEENIPSVLLNPEPYMENSKVKAALSLTKAYGDPELSACLLEFVNCKLQGIILNYTDIEIATEIATLKQALINIKTLPEMQRKQEFLNLLNSINDDDEVYESFLENISRKPYMGKLIDYCRDFETFGEGMAIKRESDYSGIVLTTAHSSKGLEWPIVYNSISKYWGVDTMKRKDAEEERRRLFFVSATRARDELYITGQTRAFGTKDDAVYNQYLIETCEILGMAFPYNI